MECCCTEGKRTYRSYKATQPLSETFEQQVHNAYHELMKDGEHITTETLKNRLTGKEAAGRMLIVIFKDHNDRMEKLVGKEFAPGTLGRYRTYLSHTLEFLKWKYRISDINIKKIDYAF